MIRDALARLGAARRKYPFPLFCRKLLARLKARLLGRFSLPLLRHPLRTRRLLRQMLSEDCRLVVLWRSGFGYASPLVQRPQHMARALARLGCLMIYEVSPATDPVDTLRREEERLWLFHFGCRGLERMLMRALRRCGKPKVLQVYSTDWLLSAADLSRYRREGFTVLYEYVDHLSPALSGTKELPVNIREKYEYVMRCPDLPVAVTAQRLRRDVIARRGGKNLALVSNGVDYAFFQRWEPYAFEPEFRAILDSGLPVVCYYGALASWFDYELAEKIAASGRFQVVLIGLKYDDSFDRECHPSARLHFLGPRDYRVLKYYAAAADVLMIPFRINEVTRSTNPVKLFEYMALHRPIVTTDLEECQAWSSVLIGRDHGEFLAQLDRALALRRDRDYLALLDSQARRNDWSEKARQLLALAEASAGHKENRL